MRKKNKILSSVIIAFIVLFISINSFASEIEGLIEIQEYTDEYKQWLELPEEEREKLIVPRMYDIPKNTRAMSTNVLKNARLLASSVLEKYSLKTIIPENVVVKNQMQTGSCWAFASLASLETNLALNNYYNDITAKVYDFSERHMEYATSRVFANDIINEDGFNREVGSGGNFNIAESYLTNGLGPINEDDMPFEDNEDTISIDKIKNKTVTGQIYDIVEFPSYKVSEVSTEIKNEIKEHIKNYGAIFASIHGDVWKKSSNCYNNTTGALYCKNSFLCKTDHAVVIVGWDDNYAIDNFNENQKPTSAGAWIIKNSWGEKQEYTLTEMKEIIFEELESKCIAQGWSDATQIPDETAISFFEEMGYTYNDGKAVMIIGDNGFMYVSYEDVNIYSNLMGVVKATDEVNYENIYEYNKYQKSKLVNLYKSKIYIANVFEKKTNGKEYLKQVSIDAPETYTCKVYVNPNGDSKAVEDLQEVKLKAGDTETFEAGYHTIEFAKPIEINGDKFVVVLEVQGTSSNKISYCIESNVENSIYDVVETEEGKCWVGTESDFKDNKWMDLGTVNSTNSNLSNGDSTLRAFTSSTDDSLKNIEITTPPTKTTYIEGQSFDKTGMIVTANYNNGKSKEITDYSIENGANLKVGQTSVNIKYEDATVAQKIIVEKNGIKNIKVKTEPSKIEYKAGEDFVKTGMIIEAEYKDGTTKVITDYTIEDGLDLNNGQTVVTITYEGNSVTQNITVESNPVEKIEIQKEPNKTSYVVGQDFDKTGMIVKATYKDNTEKQISRYSISDGTDLKLEQTKVTISFEDKSVTQPITVEEKAIISLSISKLPTKVEYILNKEELDLSGGKIKIRYNDGTEEELDMTSSQIKATGFNNKELGENTVILTYQGKTVEFDVDIIEEKIIVNEPVNSNFESANGKLIKIKSYTFLDESKKQYEIMEIEINNIQKAKENDKMEYYYYLSTNKNEENIEDWVKIEETENVDNKLKFEINTSKISNYQDIQNGENIYLYIKEVATRSEQQKVAITKSIVLEQGDTEIEIYLDNKKKDKTSNTGDNEKDKTVAPTIIPQTGQSIIIIFAIFVIATFGVVTYVRYKKIDK